MVTDGGNGQSRSALSAVRALGRAGREVHVTTPSGPTVAGWSRFCARRLIVPPVEDPGYRAAVDELVRRHHYDVVLPASDAALLALGHSAGVLVDKEEVTRRSVRAGFPLIPERRFADVHELEAAGPDLDYPVVVKPVLRRHPNDPTVWRADGPEDLAGSGAQGPVVVQRHLAEPMRAVAGVLWAGVLRAVVHQRYLRTWPRDCGVACAAVTTVADTALEQQLPTLLEGHDGLFQVQLLGRHVIDINPRVYGSMGLATKAGLNLADIVCALSAGEEVGLDGPMRARPGTRYRWVEGDLKHVRESVAEGDMSWREGLRAVSPSPRTAHGDLEISDPGPSAARLLYLLRTRAPGVG